MFRSFCGCRCAVHGPLHSVCMCAHAGCDCLYAVLMDTKPYNEKHSRCNAHSRAHTHTHPSTMEWSLKGKVKQKSLVGIPFSCVVYKSRWQPRKVIQCFFGLRSIQFLLKSILSFAEFYRRSTSNKHRQHEVDGNRIVVLFFRRVNCSWWCVVRMVCSEKKNIQKTGKKMSWIFRVN